MAEIDDEESPPAPLVPPEVLLSETTLISLEVIRRLDQYPMPPIPQGFVFENSQSIYKLKLLDLMEKLLNMSAVEYHRVTKDRCPKQSEETCLAIVQILFKGVKVGLDKLEEEKG